MPDDGDAKLDDRPALAAKTRLRNDPLTGEPLLLFPEGVLRLNGSAIEILSLCDGRNSVRAIISALVDKFPAAARDVHRDTAAFLDDLDVRGLLDWSGNANRAADRVVDLSQGFATSSPPSKLSNGERPLGLLAELTYRCPLGCPYCSNPTKLRHDGAELTTADWERVIREAAELGALHVHFSGGEPLLHRELPRLVATAREAGLYTNLLTSGIPFSRETAEKLRSAGLDHVQLSLQSDEPSLADQIAGRRSHAAKLEVARIVREFGWPLTINVVLHRENIDRLPKLIALAEELGADRLELANVQFYGWAHRNRTALLPDLDALRDAAVTVAEARARLKGRLRIDYVLPDALAERPKPCMEGWGRRYLTVNPQGDVLPCPTASCIESLRFDNVRQHSLRWIWEESDAFNRFRGTAWMPEPCRSCEWRHTDFGGCRCQAALLTGDAANTDPACSLSPFRSKLLEAFPRVGNPAIEPPLVYRRHPASASGVVPLTASTAGD
jgi:pyrroloquinoline quinone biosynthesis protein E